MSESVIFDGLIMNIATRLFFYQYVRVSVRVQQTKKTKFDKKPTNKKKLRRQKKVGKKGKDKDFWIGN